VRISVEGRRLAALLGRLQPLRVKRDIPPDRDGWLHATFRLGSIEGSTIDVLSLGPHIEVVDPPELRDAVNDWSSRTTRLYRRRASARLHGNRHRRLYTRTAQR
jgi:hypothetical protein